MSNGLISKQSEGICVGIRMRPLNEKEVNSGLGKLFQCQTDKNSVSQMSNGQSVETFYYDRVFDEDSSTTEVYQHIGKGIVDGVMNGINGTIFAYGQTSSGKTHTMLGGGEQAGVLNMAAQDIFAHISAHPHRDYLLRASFVEIYNENIRDLLSIAAPGVDATVAIREDPRRGVYCEAQEVMISDYDSITRVLTQGISRRAVEATAMNDTSSRSHTIFKLVVESRESNRDGQEADGAVLVATFNLVDLAGSESVKHTGAMGQRAKEGGKINQSLLSLSRVIHSLSQPGAHVNFRDSKLTRLLQPSLCGNAKMSICCCITPADRYLEETRSTLQFASRAKLVETHATVNEVLDDTAVIRRLKKELEVLKATVNSDEGVEALRLANEAMEQQLRELVEANALKDSQIAKLMEAGSEGFSGGTERRRSKRLRASQGGGGSQSGHEEGELEEQQDAEPAEPVKQKNDIKNALMLHFQRRAQDGPSAAAAEAMAEQSAQLVQATTATSSCDIASTSNSSATPAVVAVATSQKEEVPRPINPMVLGLRNQLMKELDVKLVKQRTKVEEEPSSAAAAGVVDANGDSMDVSAAANVGGGEEVATLQEKLSQCEQTIAEQVQAMQALRVERDSVTEQLQEVSSNGISQTAVLESQIAALKAELDAATKQQQEDIASSTPATTTTTTTAESSSELLAKISLLEEEKMLLQEEVTTLLEQLEEEPNNTGGGAEAVDGQQVEDLKTELAATKDSLAASETEVASLLEQLEQAESAGGENASLLTAARAEADSLHTQLQELEATSKSSAAAVATQLADLESQLAQQLEQSTAAEEQLAAADEATAHAEEALSSARAEIARGNGEMEAMRAQVVELTAQVAAAEQTVLQLSHVQSEMQELQGKYNESLATIESLHANATMVAETQSEEVGPLRDQLAAATEQVTVLNDQLEQKDKLHQEAIALLEAQHKAVLEEQEEAASTHLSNAQETLARVEAENASLTEQVQSLTGQLTESQANATANADIMTDLEASLEHALAEQQKAEESVATAESRIEELCREKEELEAKATEAAEASASGMARLSEFDINQESIDAARKEMERQVSHMHAALGHKEAEVSRLMAALSESQERTSTAEQRLANIDGNHDKNENDSAFTAKRVGQLQTTVDLLTGEKSALEMKFEAAEKEFKTRLGAASVTQEQLERDVMDKTAQVEKLSQSLEQLRHAQDAMIQLQQQLESSTTACKEAEVRATTADQRLSELETLLADVQTQQGSAGVVERDSLQEQVAQLTSEKLRMQEDMTETLQRMKKSQESAAQIRTEWELTEVKHQNLIEEHERALENVQQLTAALEEANNQQQEACSEAVAGKDADLLSAEAAAMRDSEVGDESKKMDEDVEEVNVSSSSTTSPSPSSPSAEPQSAEDSTSPPQQVLSSTEAAAAAAKSEQALKSMEVQLIELQAKVDDLTGQLELQQEELNIKQQKVTVLEEEVALSTETHSQEMEALKTEMNELKETMGSDAAQSAQMTGVCKLQADQIASLELDVDRAKQSVAEAESKLPSLQAELDLAKKDLQTTIEAKDEAIEAQRQQLEEVRSELQTQTATHTEAIASLTERLAEANALNGTLCDSDHVLKESVKALEEKAQTLEAENVANASTITELEAALQSTKIQLVAAQEAEKTLEEQLQEQAQRQASNALLEEEAGALKTTIVGLETRCAELEEQLGESQEAFSKGTEKFHSIQEELLAKSTEVEAVQEELGAAKKEKEDISVQLVNLQGHVVSLEDTIAKLEQGGDEKMEQLIKDTAASAGALEKLQEELQSAKDLCASHEDKVNSLTELLDTKEKRILHLEQCKLTKEQMEKIKVIKEEKKKYQEDSKTLKKQLHQLSIKFEELRHANQAIPNGSSNSSAGGGPSPEYIISDLKVQLVTTQQQLTQTTEEVKLLKSKLKECAVQLKDYETDHHGIVSILQKYGVDTRGLLPMEHSSIGLEEQSASADSSALQGAHADIADAVAHLGEKLDQAKAAVTRRETAKTERATDLEQRLAEATTEVEDIKAQKVALEKRLEALKATAKTARETNATQSVEIEALTAQVGELKEKLRAAENRVVSSSEVVSSEVQALEEENIDLLKENKELRLEVTRFRAQQSVAGLGTAVAPSSSSSSSSSSSAATSSSMAAKSPATASVPTPSTASKLLTLSGNKRAFGTDLSNQQQQSDADVSSVTKPALMSSQQSLVEETASASAVAANTTAPAGGGGGKTKTRRTRMKAKALVDEAALGGSQQQAEEAGECKQS